MTNLNRPDFDEGHVVEEEMIVVLDGSPQLRTPDGSRRLDQGEIVVFPPGEGGGHQVWNDTAETVRFLSMSSWMNGPEICFYPDSGKVGVFAEDVYELYNRDGQVDYWQGETPPAGSEAT